MVREHADKVLSDADADDGGGSLVALCGGAATTAARQCAASCLHADAAFRPSAFRNQFPHELSVLQ